MGTAHLPPRGPALDLLCVVLWESPRQGRCPPALRAKLLLDREPQTSMDPSVGKRDSSQGVPTTSSFPKVMLPGAQLSLSQVGRGKPVSRPHSVFTRRAVHFLLHRPVGRLRSPDEVLGPSGTLEVQGPHQPPCGSPARSSAGRAVVTFSGCPQVGQAGRDVGAGGAGPGGGHLQPAEEPGGGQPEDGP